MHHQQYRDSLLLRLREWKLSNIDATIAAARRELRPKLTKADIDLLFDNWLNANFDRIEVKQTRLGKVAATIHPHRTKLDPGQKGREAVLAQRLKTRVKANLFEEFAARIWDTVLPNGVIMRDATGKDMAHATGWFAEIGKHMGPNEKVAKKFTTKQLFDLSQREKFTARA